MDNQVGVSQGAFGEVRSNNKHEELFMKKLVLFLVVTFLLSVFSFAWAHNKVVVVPLGENVPLRIYYGSVRSLGSLETGNIDSSSRTAAGSYSLNVGDDVGGCAVTVTKGSQGSGSSNIYGNITANVPNSGTVIFVRTRDSAGTLDNTDFHFTAICPK
jgi:hypothetical protein